MIVIRNFADALNLYRAGLIPLRLLQEQTKVLTDIFPQPNRYVTDALDIAFVDISWLAQQPEILQSDYNGMLGGEVLICETEVDLQQILGMDLNFARTHGNRWPNVTEQVMSWDACDYLSELNGTPKWAMFLLCWNDAGGPVFYVPRHLWKAARVEEHVAATRGFWNTQI